MGAAAVRAGGGQLNGVTLAEAPDVLTVDECAQLARTGPKPIYRAIARGELYGRRIGKNIRVPKRAFVAWLEGSKPSSRPIFGSCICRTTTRCTGTSSAT